MRAHMHVLGRASDAVKMVLRAGRILSFHGLIRRCRSLNMMHIAYEIDDRNLILHRILNRVFPLLCFAESLRDYFSQFGEITEVMVMKDPTTRRTRFVHLLILIYTNAFFHEHQIHFFYFVFT